MLTRETANPKKKSNKGQGKYFEQRIQQGKRQGKRSKRPKTPTAKAARKEVNRQEIEAEFDRMPSDLQQSIAMRMHGTNEYAFRITIEQKVDFP